MAVPGKKPKEKKRRLGKGLESLLSKAVEVTAPEPASADTIPAQAEVVSKETPAEAASAGLVYLHVENIRPNARQPRQVFDDEALTALADSIKTAGLMQPIVVRPSASSGEYELVAGERRWRAAQIAGLKQIPSIVKEIDDKTSAEWALVENLQREDLNPIDRAEAFDRLVVDFNATQKEIATQLGINRSSVANFLRLNDLEPTVKDAVRDGRLSMGHAKVLLGIPDVSTTKAIARRCAQEQWSVRELETQLKKLGQVKSGKQTADPSALTMYMRNLAEQLGEHLGTKVSISAGKKKGSGKLNIDFYSNDQFEGILDQLKFKPKS
ncbi:MAG: chromosome partitioning protein ParB [Phycisphaerae bacterium]|nr:chromosome partitioning protein ParB [Phycisphaerae bacterium]